MSSIAQSIKRLIPSRIKGYRAMRYVRFISTPVLGTWNNLINTGQLRSILKGKPVDRNGAPLPWFSFPAIHYLDQLHLKGLRVFEYGTGNSTLFWIRKECSLCAVEFDAGWADYVRKNAGESAIIQREDNVDQYAASITNYEQNFDIIIVDGAARQACARFAIDKLSKDGFIILDNSEAYPSVAKFLSESGLIQVDFIGPAPLVHNFQATSFFFRRTHEMLSDNAPKLIPGMTVFPKDWKAQ